MSKIFVQIASYRDPELIPTLKSALENAVHPENLNFTVCWQFHPQDPYTQEQEQFLGENGVNVIPVNLSEKSSLGTCWARHSIQQHYTDEEYTLQLDSHMRFNNDWDSVAINMFKGLQEEGHAKPLITGYVPSFNPEKEPEGRLDEIWYMVFDRFAPEGWVATKPWVHTDKSSLTKPIPAIFYSAHFAFTLGEFSKEVQHDPEFYFHGEEPSIAVRAYTHGYDLFHPHKIICWHEYLRNNKVKQWDDDKQWTDKNNHAHKKYRQLFGMDGEEMLDLSPYGFGKERTLEDFKRYSGIDFSNRTIQQYTLDANPPPVPEDKVNEEFKPFFRHCLDINSADFPEPDYDFWVVSFENEDGSVVYNREDADKREVYRLIKEAKDGDGWIRLWRQYYGEIPEKAVIWAHSESKGWLNRLEIQLSN